MGNCANCEDPNVQETRNELKPTKKILDNQENIPQIRPNLKTLEKMPTFHNPLAEEALNKIGPYNYEETP